ncbi:major capsid protein P2 [uncultured Celeribacter sp.]|uniref:major capsid protein P2 n=1 Tax=uncultured Celeribacter sp. TaxID=1303376 RepID=UPI002AA5FA43|nr:major capsid protein P2 [uncultured Celeribacter sp.]
MRRIEKMPTPQGIGAGQTAIVNLPIGPTYHRLNVRMNVNVTPRDVEVANWGAYIGEIRLMVNGETKIEIDAADLVSLNLYYGQEMSAGVLPLFLSQPWARTLAGEDNTAYGTGSGVATMTLEMDLKNGITVNELSVYAVQSEPRAFAGHLRIQRFSDQMGLAGTKEIADLPKGAFNLLGLHVTSDDIDKVEVLTNNVKVHESDEVLRNAHLSVAGRAPQIGFTHIDFMSENRLGEVLPMTLRDFRVKLDFTAPGTNFKIYSVSMRSPATST